MQVRVCAAVRRPAVPAAVTDPLRPDLVGAKEALLFDVGPCGANTTLLRRDLHRLFR